jgi:hypothetical protein
MTIRVPVNIGVLNYNASQKIATLSAQLNDYYPTTSLTWSCSQSVTFSSTTSEVTNCTFPGNGVYNFTCGAVSNPSGSGQVNYQDSKVTFLITDTSIINVMELPYTFDTSTGILTITMTPFNHDMNQFRNNDPLFARQGWYAIDENGNNMNIMGPNFEKISEVIPTFKYKLLYDGEYTLSVFGVHVPPVGGYWDWSYNARLTFHVKNFKPVINSITSDPISPFVGQTTTITSNNTNFVNSVSWNYGDV